MASKIVPIQPSADAIRQHLDRMLASPEFANSERMSSFLRSVVDQTLAGKTEMLKESVIGVHVFDRDPSYDPKTDPVVRGEARRLRAKLLDYSHSRPDDPLHIDLPKGGYVAEFHWRAAGAADSRVQELPLHVVPPRSCIRRHATTVVAGAAVALLAVGAWLFFGRAPTYSFSMRGRRLLLSGG